MVATVIINEWNATASQTDKTSGTVRFKNANDATVDANNPLVIPTSGQEYSYEKWLRLQITGTPPDDRIDALQFYLDGANNYGSGVLVWAEVTASNTFRTPGLPNESLDPPLGGSGSLTMTDAFSYTSGAPLELAVGARTYSASSTHIGDFVVLVMEVNSTATQGTLTAETATFEYDEI